MRPRRTFSFSRFCTRALILFVLHSTGVPAASAWWDGDWTKRVRLTFLNGGQAENFTSFPVLVRLDAKRVNYADIRNAGEDIRFVDSDDATVLAHEIELWNEAGSSYLWVRVPQVDASSNADFIWMYYGNPVAPDGQSPAGVWDTDFKMVHHLKETAGAHLDSTSNNNDSVSVQVTAQGSGAGRIDGADVFSGTDDVEVADAATLDIGAAESFTLEAWVKTSLAAGGQMIVSKEDGAGGQYQLWTDNGNAKFWLRDGVASQAHAQSTTFVADDQWHYVVGRWSEATGTAEVFVNGTSVASATNGALGAMSGARALRMGEEGDSDPEGGFNFQGTIDEVRLSKTARSNNWIRAQHLSMTDAFVSFGGPQPSGAMLVKSGTYTGNGTDDRPIFVGFQPDVVLVDMDEAVNASPNEAVIRTSTMAPDASKAIEGIIPIAADKIQSFTATGFIVGTHATVNEPGATYRWVAFRAAPGKLKVGSYPGDGSDDRSITGVGFQPEYVIIMGESGVEVMQRSSAMPGDLTHNYEAAGHADAVQALEADGFQVGQNARVNSGGTTYHYAAWNLVPGEVAVGAYTGDGVTDNRNITGVGFFPEYVVLSRSLGVPGSGINSSTHKLASTGVGTDRSLLFRTRIGESDNIQALQPDGFQVGLHNRVNAGAAPNIYYWIAIGPHLPQTNYRSIGTASDVSGTLTATQDSVVVTDLSATWRTGRRGRGDRIGIGGTDYTVAWVDSETQLQLTAPFTGATGPYAYTLSRQYATLQLWENCISFGGACSYFPVVSGDLVSDDRREVGVVYADSVFVAASSPMLVINGSNTDSLHTITLTAGPYDRHHGIAGDGVVLQGGGVTKTGVDVQDDYTVIEWLELRGFHQASTSGAAAVRVDAANVLLQQLLIHDFVEPAGEAFGIKPSPTNPAASFTVRNSIVYNGANGGIILDNGGTATVENCTIYGMTNRGVLLASGTLTVTNTISLGSPLDFRIVAGSMTGSHNMSSDATASTLFAGDPNAITGANSAVEFVDDNFGTANLHLAAGAQAIDRGADRSGSFTGDIDGGLRLTPWDMGADDFAATTRVELLSFEARGENGAVELLWETGTELDNLGFHLYRALSEAGPYSRITAHLIPGLGSSPEGARYRYLDVGVSNGTAVFYKLEDVETTGRKTLHGPVSAVASAAAGSTSGSRSRSRVRSLVTYGEPEGNALRVVSESDDELVVELTTEGFYAEPGEDGTVVVEIPGFEPLGGTPSVPVLRPWVRAPSGTNVRITSVNASSVQSFAGLHPSGRELQEASAGANGTVRARRRRTRAPMETRERVPLERARVLGVGFQGESRKVQLELAPLQWDGAAGELVLSRKLTVHLSFSGRADEGRRRVREPAPGHARGPLARLVTREAGLHEVRYEALFRRAPGVSSDALRVSRQGIPVAHHVEPAGRAFGPGSKLYFVSESARAHRYGDELVYELDVAPGGRSMELGSAEPRGASLVAYLEAEMREEHRYYQAGLLDAPDPWLWELIVSGSTKSFPFEVRELAPGPSRLKVWLQGVSDVLEVSDHHVRLLVNGAERGESLWDGKRGEHVVVELPPEALQEGWNRLEVENVGDTGASYSMVMLDRFEVVYPRSSVAKGGSIEGEWLSSGEAVAAGLGAGYVVDVTEASPRWLQGARVSSDGSLRFGVEAGRRYLAVSAEGVKQPVVRTVPGTRLRKQTEGAEYLVIGPREFHSVARPLLEHRREDGLSVAYAAVEDVYSEFGFGEPSPEAIREYLEWAYHRWEKPRLRYVLLAGDATYDYKDYLGTGVQNRVPPLLVKTSYLWTVSDPSLVTVHGEDLLPDVAIGRLPAANADEMRVMVEKILTYETGAADLGSALVLVTDNPDRAGDFDANAEEIARGVLSRREVRRVSLAELGASTRVEILSALDEGASLLSYIGHGGIHLWADENVFNTTDVTSLSAQAQQPLVLTMNCLNGYFHFPYFDSLAESLLKAEGKGAVAAFSPSGLSLDAPAHRFHVALLDALFNQPHERLGDAVLAAQESYAASGAFPELLSIYHLLGDPALRLR